MNYNAKISKTILSLYILLLPILRYYNLPGGNNLYLLIANIIVIYLIVRKRYIIINNKLTNGACLFIIWASVISFIAYNFSEYHEFVQKTSANNLIVLCDWVFIAVACCHEIIDYDNFVNIYKWICYILLVYIFLQIVGIHIPGFTMTGRISFLDVASEYSIRGRNFGVYPSGMFTRYSSLFIEPSHFSQYMAPFLCLSLFGYKDIINKNLIIAGMVSALMIMSISGTSIIIVMIIWIYYMFTEMKHITKTKIVLLVVLIIAFLFCIVLAMQNAGIISMLERMSNSSDNKVVDRVTRGFQVFLRLPIIQKIFGIGYQCIYPASKVYGIEVGYSVADNVKEYVNDVASILVSFGLIGFMPIGYMVCRGFMGAKKREIAVYIASLAICLSDCTFGAMWLLLICICISVHKNRL